MELLKSPKDKKDFQVSAASSSTRAEYNCGRERNKDGGLIRTDFMRFLIRRFPHKR